MRRFDLRHLHGDFYDRMTEIMDKEAIPEEVIIFMFEIGDFTPIQKSANIMKEAGHELINSLKFNEADWTLVVKRKT